MRIRILGQYVHGSLAVLALVEFVLVAGAMFAATVIRFPENLVHIQAEHGPLLPRMLLFGLTVLLSLMAFGMYSSRQRAPAFGIAIRLFTSICAATVGTTVVFFLIPDVWVGRGVMALAAILALLALMASRYVFSYLVDDEVFKRRVLVYGSGERARSIAGLRRRTDRRGFSVVGYVASDGESCSVPREQLLDAAESMLSVCARLDVDEVVVAMDDRRRAFPILGLLECRLAGIDVTELLTFLERETGRVRIDVLNPSWMIFGEGFRRGPIRLFTGRMLDLLASLVIVTVSLPAMLVTACAIKLEDGWRAPVLYRQSRVGFGGNSFDVLKFRSMRTDAEVAGGAQWAQKSDPRVTRVGAIIRKLRIDELPQILNVLRGHMSFVGPRPERPQFVAQLAEKIPYYVQRHCVKPGITGWAQLCYPYGSSEQDALEKLQYDLYYIKNNSLLFDLAIIVQTAEVVILGKGAR
ncbi:MAG TPA: TIGR03013 family XrtA/PEP-CTERM system glycosyltransferase [Steroidobacteraceae bacterium]|nr:TIGR03013 family XrtA/PEP-CTERM system glycosyltransferase [Steroidobacteraceae bacterium]